MHYDYNFKELNLQLTSGAKIANIQSAPNIACRIQFVQMIVQYV